MTRENAVNRGGFFTGRPLREVLVLGLGGGEVGEAGRDDGLGLAGGVQG